MKRLCVLCKHLQWLEGSPGYSEWTPGWDSAMGCNKGHWDGGSFNDMSLEQYRRYMLTAETCKDYQEEEVQ